MLLPLCLLSTASHLLSVSISFDFVWPLLSRYSLVEIGYIHYTLTLIWLSYTIHDNFFSSPYAATTNKVHSDSDPIQGSQDTAPAKS